ncbi:MAG: sigma factor-like helix-turn-helix DNA-binding protein [Solirubrobacteraceae bacterium]
MASDPTPRWWTGSASRTPGYTQVEARAAFEPLIGPLKPLAREVVRLRIEEDLTQQAIGDRVGVSQMHVSRILRASFDWLGGPGRPRRPLHTRKRIGGTP